MDITGKNYVILNIFYYITTILLLCSSDVTSRGISLPEIGGISFRRQVTKDFSNDGDQSISNTQWSGDRPVQTLCKDCGKVQHEPDEKTNRRQAALRSKRKHKHRKKKRTKNPRGSTENIYIEDASDISRTTGISLQSDNTEEYKRKKNDTNSQNTKSRKNERTSKNIKLQHSVSQIDSRDEVRLPSLRSRETNINPLLEQSSSQRSSSNKDIETIVNSKKQNKRDKSKVKSETKSSQQSVQGSKKDGREESRKSGKRGFREDGKKGPRKNRKEGYKKDGRVDSEKKDTIESTKDRKADTKKVDRNHGREDSRKNGKKDSREQSRQNERTESRRKEFSQDGREGSIKNDRKDDRAESRKNSRTISRKDRKEDSRQDGIAESRKDGEKDDVAESRKDVRTNSRKDQRGDSYRKDHRGGSGKDDKRDSRKNDNVDSRKDRREDSKDGKTDSGKHGKKDEREYSRKDGRSESKADEKVKSREYDTKKALKVRSKDSRKNEKEETRKDEREESFEDDRVDGIAASRKDGRKYYREDVGISVNEKTQLVSDPDEKRKTTGRHPARNTGIWGWLRGLKTTSRRQNGRKQLDSQKDRKDGIAKTRKDGERDHVAKSRKSVRTDSRKDRKRDFSRKDDRGGSEKDVKEESGRSDKADSGQDLRKDSKKGGREKFGKNGKADSGKNGRKDEKEYSRKEGRSESRTDEKVKSRKHDSKETSNVRNEDSRKSEKKESKRDGREESIKHDGRDGKKESRKNSRKNSRKDRKEDSRKGRIDDSFRKDDRGGSGKDGREESKKNIKADSRTNRGKDSRKGAREEFKKDGKADSRKDGTKDEREYFRKDGRSESRMDEKVKTRKYDSKKPSNVRNEDSRKNGKEESRKDRREKSFKDDRKDGIAAPRKDGKKYFIEDIGISVNGKTQLVSDQDGTRKTTDRDSTRHVGKLGWLRGSETTSRRQHGGRRKQLDPRRPPAYNLQEPPGVSRLERRLRPGLHAYGSEIMATLQRVLRQVQYRMRAVHMDYEYMFNSTRYNMMLGVREELKLITTQSNKIYNTVLGLSEFEKTVYQHAGMPQHVQALPHDIPKELPLLKIRFGDTLYEVQNMLWESNRTKMNVDRMKVQCQQLKAQSLGVEDRLKERMPNGELLDLSAIANKTTRRIKNGSMKNTKLKLRRYKNLDIIVNEDLSNATGYYRLAHENLISAMDIFHLNVRNRDVIRSRRRQNGRREPATAAVSESLEPAVRAALKEIISKASKHARNLRGRFHLMKETLSPAMKAARVVLDRTGDSAKQLYFMSVGKAMIETTGKIGHTLDRIRIFIGDEHVLKSRCEEIVAQMEGSGFFEDFESPINCDDYIEGSGIGLDTDAEPITVPKTKPKSSPAEKHLIEGSGFEIDTEGAPTSTSLPLTTDEENSAEDFFFGFFSDDPETLEASKPSFGEKLQDFTSNYHSKSEDVFQKSEKIKWKMSDISERWGTTMFNIRQMTKNSHDITNFLNFWEESQIYMNNISNRIPGTLEKIHFKSNLTETKAFNAERTIDRLKRETDKGKRSERTSNDQPNAGDAAAVAQVAEAVGKVVGKVQSIMTLKRVYTDPCQKLRDQANWLRSNITELKRKIEKASLAATSIQMSVSMSGSGHLHIPLHHQPTESLTTSVSLCVRPEGGDAPLVVIQGNQSVTYALTIENAKPVLTLYGKDGKQIHKMDKANAFHNGNWYRLQVKRSGQQLTFVTSPLTSPEEGETSQETTVPLMAPVQSMPSVIHLGGVPENVQSTYGDGWWKGCVADFFMDSHYVGLMRRDSKGNVPELCENCPAAMNTSIVMEGGGYVKFPMVILDQTKHVESINLQFRTNQPGGLLFLLNDKRQKLQLLISLIDGGLLMEARIHRGTFGGTTVTRSTNRMYSDGNLHEINVGLMSDRIKINTDDGDDPFVQETSTQEIPVSIQEGIFLGGINGLVHSSSDDKFRPLLGCIPSLKINRKVVLLAALEDARNTYLGSCNQDIWSTCARFSPESEPVSLPEIEKLNKIYLGVTPDSRGPVLHYKKGRTLSLVIVSDKLGLEVTEVVSDDSSMIFLEPEETQLWNFITVTDRKGEVDIESGGNKLTMKYEENSKGWWTDKKPLPAKISVILGGTVDEGETTGGFEGAISSILLDDRPISLEGNMTDHNLQFCTKPLVIKTEPKPDVKPTC